MCAGIITTGCLENNQSISEATVDSVIVRNLDDTAHTLQSKIERNGEVIVNKTIEVSARSDGRKSLAVLGETFSKTPAEYHIFATIEGSNTEISTELGAVQELNCINAEIRIT
ncbi:hypothetical protein, partial [Halorhabdus salina]|uniref:hypothetical protein n=1 Tax=Halorhabdus salina TaxID=2750670 RepID=UPI001C67D6CA